MKIVFWMLALASAVTNLIFCQALEFPYPEYCTNIDELEVNREWDEFGTAELIKAHGYPSETHFVLTDDGYILTIHRIPRPECVAIFILHGILCTSRELFMQRGNNSLAFLLFNACYDVWLGNMRGNDYSRTHVTMDPDEPAFWHFSYDEIANKDVSAMMKYIYLKTTKPFHCLGYSLGSTTIIAALITDTELQCLCRLFVGLAPVVRNFHATAPALVVSARLTVPEQPLKTFLYGVEPTGQFTPRSMNALIRKYLPSLCLPDLDQPGFCQHFVYLLLGWVNLQQVDEEMSSRIYHLFPSWTSVMTLIQVIRGVLREIPFSMYKYQTAKQNEMVYDQAEPPEYNLGKFQVPTYLLVGPLDEVATKEDVYEWADELGVKAKIDLVKDSLWGHLDFMWAKEACSYAYVPVLKQLWAFDAISPINRTCGPFGFQNKSIKTT